MYAIIIWITEDYLTFVTNADGSVKMFQQLKEADRYANQHDLDDSMRVISLEGVKA